MILEILQYPHPSLYTMCRRVVKFDKKLRVLAQNMIDTVENDKAVGLSSNQVGKPIRMIVVKNIETNRYTVLCNPSVVKATGSQIGNEGCLSQKGEFIEIERPNKVTISYQDLNGTIRQFKGEGLMARVLIHEQTHLLGLSYTDEKSNLWYLWEK